MHITTTPILHNSTHEEVPSFLATPSILQLTCNKGWTQQYDGKVYANVTEKLLQDFFEIKNPNNFESTYLLLPNGFTTLMFMLSSQGSSSFMCGAMTTVRYITIPSNATLFCVRLKPGTIHEILNHNSHDFTDRVVPLHYYFSWANELLGLLHEIQTYEQRCLTALGFLSRYNKTSYEIRPVVRDVLDLIHKYKGNVRIRDICNMLSRNERSVYKVFLETVGVTPKAYADLVRFLHTIYTITTMPKQHLSTVPKECGYFDQPHMNRAFRKYFGYTANDILRLNMHEIFVADLFKDSKP